VEILFPLKDAVIRERVCTEILGAYLSDTCKARLLCSNGGYSRVRAGRNGVAVNAQDHLLRVAASADGASRVRVMKATEPVDSTPGMTASDDLQEELDDAGRGDV
jgi:polyphosphate kinase